MTGMNLRALHDTIAHLELDDEECRTLYRYMLGALAGYVPEATWARLLAESAEVLRPSEPHIVACSDDL
jgi:hypothetical protein